MAFNFNPIQYMNNDDYFDMAGFRVEEDEEDHHQDSSEENNVGMVVINHFSS